MKTLNVINFIRNNRENWMELLQEEPFNLNVKLKDGYAIIKYSKMGCDFSNPIVRECRGIIINVDTLAPVCVPFYKFGNIQESYADEIDWETARVLEKLDGSLMKLWFDYDGWTVSTNGMIDARDATLSAPVVVSNFTKDRLETFHDLFLYAVKDLEFYKILDRLDKNNTYMFELTSPYNKVVVSHPETRLYHIGTRNNKTLLELEYDIPEFDKPTVYNVSSIDECVRIALEELPFDDEGFVVVDGDYNRIKIKSKEYVDAHRLVSGGVPTPKNIISIILDGKSDDFLSYYPEYKLSFDEVDNSMWEYIAVLMKESTGVPDCDTRKAFAEWAKTTTNMGYFFGIIDGKWESPKDWMWSLSADKILELIGLE